MVTKGVIRDTLQGSRDNSCCLCCTLSSFVGYLERGMRVGKNGVTEPFLRRGPNGTVYASC